MVLKGKVAVVTGGTAGLGQVVARVLADAGATVVSAARGASDAVGQFPVDVTDRASVDALFSAVQERHGGLDILVANAGINHPGPLATLPPEQWDEVLATNLTGVLNCVRAAVPLLRAAGDGRIVTVSSLLGRRPIAGGGAYGVSKAALETLTRVLAAELAVDGITVNAVAPGVVDEGMGRAILGNDRLWNRLRGSLATERPGTGAEVARAILFLASPDSSYVNGHVLNVDGGLNF
ncbi:SDR family NAD(P)-dependent oxidoreductase [Micromonospora lupini]|uniref:SDR family NAD(P)-dependent oxidoreductase n=1 Tax=Micromonospora lupini TaxID=285679 RepID=UPI0033C59F57